jgi:hypothetical protein
MRKSPPRSLRDKRGTSYDDSKRKYKKTAQGQSRNSKMKGTKKRYRGQG